MGRRHKLSLQEVIVMKLRTLLKTARKHQAHVESADSNKARISSIAAERLRYERHWHQKEPLTTSAQIKTKFDGRPVWKLSGTDERSWRLFDERDKTTLWYGPSISSRRLYGLDVHWEITQPEIAYFPHNGCLHELRRLGVVAYWDENHWAPVLLSDVHLTYCVRCLAPAEGICGSCLEWKVNTEAAVAKAKAIQEALDAAARKKAQELMKAYAKVKASKGDSTPTYGEWLAQQSDAHTKASENEVNDLLDELDGKTANTEMS